jgi:hypothetical protein
MIMVYITGDIIQPDCTRKTGPQWVHTIDADDELSRPRALDWLGLSSIADLIRDYERLEGQCSSFAIVVVK